MIKYLKNNQHFILAFAVFLIYFSPNLFFQDEAHILIRDNLDSNVVWYKNIAQSTVLFGDNSDTVDWIKNGIPRGLFVSEFNIIIWLYYFFSPETAYHINIILQTLIAFIGMMLFVSKYVFIQTKDKLDKYVITLISLIYALLPFWPSSGIGISGLPLLMYVLLNIYYKTEKKWEWLILIFFPFYSSLFFSGVFTVSLFFFYFLTKQIIDKRINIRIFVAFALITLFYLLVEYRLIQMILIEGYESGRVISQIRTAQSLNIKGVIGLTFKEFAKGYYHYHKMIYPIVFFVVLFSLFLLKNERTKIVKGLIIIYVLSLFPTVFFLKEFHFLLELGYLKSFQLRWHVVVPFLWYWLFAYVVYHLILKYKKFSFGVISMLSIQLLFVLFSVGDNNFYGNEYAENGFYRTFFDKENKEAKSFKEYYRYKDFDIIKKYIPSRSKVVCIGITPAIAQFHGYKTFGGYYSLNKKGYLDLFKKIQNIEQVNFYNKAYLNINTEINYALLKKLGYRYLFSSFSIDNNNLYLIKKINNSLYIYKIN